MISLILPVGSFHGWGVCGKYLTKELSELTDVRLITYLFDTVGDPVDYYFLKTKFAGAEFSEGVKAGSIPLDTPVLQAFNGEDMLPWEVYAKAPYKVGYSFLADNLLTPEYVGNAKEHFDFIAAGCSWCEESLRNCGLNNVRTIIQGIDPQIFNPSYSEKEYFKDKFVIFSGGKFELRKGQDLVIRAFKILQDKYDDVLLVNHWINFWDKSFCTMAGSRHIVFSVKSNDFTEKLSHILTDNGIDLNKVIPILRYPNPAMARIYKNTDIGLFPNRCEGGTNLVLMEYMACGKPVIASYNTGHKDILTKQNSLPLESMMPLRVHNGQRDIALWYEPNLDEIVAFLEWAYHHRDSLKEIGNRAGQDLSRLTWKKTAKEFFELLQHG